MTPLAGQLVRGAALLLAGGSCSAAGPAVSAGQAERTELPGTRLCTLGTAGGPGAQADRAGIASLLLVDGRRYLVDAGSGVSRQLVTYGVREHEIPVVFLTHLHDDHTAGLAELMTFAYTTRTPGMQIVGPPRTASLVESATVLLQYSAEIRLAEHAVTVAPAARFSGRDALPGVIYADEVLQVTAVDNSHYNLAADSPAARNRSYALRFKTRDRVIVMTGDTGVSPAVEKLAKGADLLVAEMATPGDLSRVPAEVRRHMELEHLSPIQVGQLAARAGVKSLLLSHVRAVTPAHLADVRRDYRGDVQLGQDLHCY